MKVLFVHQNFPGQFRHIAAHLAKRAEFDVIAIGRDTAPGLPGVRILRYKPHRSVADSTHPYVRSFEDAVLHGQQVMRLLLSLKSKGYRPDVIVAHPGWGETLFAKDVFPDARLIHFCEYYYHSNGADANFDSEFPLNIDGAARLRSRNALHLLNLENCDVGVTPTLWQHSLHPEAYRKKIRVIHEGINTQELKPDVDAQLALPNGEVLKAGMPIVTYVARNLEPYRGFHKFMRALPEILGQHPDCRIVIVGGDAVSYGRKPPDFRNWREKLLNENKIDLSRVHFLGKVPYETYRRVLQVSAAHVYFTYPFVLSWSLLEALASGCLVVGSDTAPVREVINNGENGFLVEFSDTKNLVLTLKEALNFNIDNFSIRKKAVETSRYFSRDRGVLQYFDLIVSGKVPSAVFLNEIRQR